MLIYILGVITLSTIIVCLVASLLFLSYIIFDALIKRLIGWDNKQTRENIFYFIKHKKEIQEYIKNKGNKN